MGGQWKAFRKLLGRKKIFEPEQLEAGNLRRCLNQWDLAGLGLGSTLGVGVYVLVGSVALHIAGPSIVLSFLVAAVTTLFAGLCYAEFGSRVPRAGSSYIYAYVSVGEFVAFLIGWNVILENLFGTASVARGLSMYIDSMAGGSVSAWFTSVVPISSSLLSPYFDFVAFFILIVFGVLLAVGVRESSTVNNVFAALNMTVILFIVVAGAFTANSSNWSIPESEVPASFGTGGFFPYGVWGMLRGAAVCFYGFVGFETISASSEEVRNPTRCVPFAILVVLVIVFVAYASVAAIVTMMVPYYLLDNAAGVATAFTYVGMDWARWIVSIGAVFGIMTSLVSGMLPLPRLLYAMASDGLFIHWFAKVSATRKSPVIATILPVLVIAILAAIMELDQLILTMCIGTLFSYTIVAACVIVLRYRSDSKPELTPGFMKLIFSCGQKSPTRASSRIIDITLFLYICACVAMALVAVHLDMPVVPLSVLHALALGLVLVMTLQPKAKEELVFKTPLVPIIPCLSIYVNIHLMILVNYQTWIRVVIWILIGIPVYFLFVCFYKRKENNLEENLKTFAHTDKNGKTPVKIVVEAPTPPGTMNRSSNYGGDRPEDEIDSVVDQENITQHVGPIKTNEIIVQQATIENNEEKEAKIIDLLDQVLQAEEDSYTEVISLKEQTDENVFVPLANDDIPHRKSLSELSDAGSDASLGNQVLSKYDVIVQVHREDLPRLNEEEEKNEKESDENEENNNNEDREDLEQVTAFNDSETNSRTDESGYSDTLDRVALNDSAEEPQEDVPYIPPPPPLDENYFANPYFKKSYTIPVRPLRQKSVELEEETKPRESVQSNNSQDDSNIVFGSDRQMSFMSKLNNIFQTKITTDGDGEEQKEEQRRRSNSTGDVVENIELALNRERPSMFFDLKRELMSLPSIPNLRPVNVDIKQETESEEEEDSSMSRDDLKSKLENIFATGGPKVYKPRVMKSNPPTPEEAYQTDTSSTESISKLPKMDKNDTLKRQKDKFGDVLNSFRLSLNKDDEL